MTNIIEKRAAEFSPLIDNLKKEVKGLNVNGITGPHFPGIGEYYEKSSYKFAFCGMETYGWESMTDFINKDSNEYLSIADRYLNNYDPLNWASNWHATFWGFVFKFLARFYKIDFQKLIGDDDDNKLRSVLKSFVWANMNSIERFDVTSKWNNADYTVWEIVKESSKI